MTVRRIVANIAGTDMAAARAFYGDLFGLEVGMDLGWIVTFVADTRAISQMSVMSEGGSGAPVPDISIEVDDLQSVHERAVSGGYEIVYPLADEPWGVRRFFVRDPFGKTINVLSHTGG
ncbi:glyoxalase superfamily protein [Devosia nitrariae]|uniref:Glyoxalase n=1 Tax=Devosia nitrariae TaxID=2071872 RepID=A0ABQ5W4U4_9HYPH|nr:glyoxalase superfamily protein [Devosia nitrariae]GLQ54873.1 glyoxalase [Devosia nitrariae]